MFPKIVYVLKDWSPDRDNAGRQLDHEGTNFINELMHWVHTKWATEEEEEEPGWKT